MNIRRALDIVKVAAAIIAGLIIVPALMVGVGKYVVWLATL